ncbi:hypothetical protein P3W53_26090 [Pseudomonas denitrificans (nom. rej.)]|nr:hypothetical protein [Pseudomonas denitrificans (nom. rej.)]
MASIFPDWVQDANTALSAVGFALSVWAIFGVASIKKRLQSRVRIPALINEIEKSGSTLNKLINTNPLQVSSAIKEIKQVIIYIRHAKPHIPSSEKKHLDKISGKLSALDDAHSRHVEINKEHLLDIYSEIQSSVTIMKEVNKSSSLE